MQPIVNGLEDEYTNITFVSLNPLDNADGESLFDQLALRGHPAILVFDASGQEIYRGYGVIEPEILVSYLE